jgi:phage terminase small subunit
MKKTRSSKKTTGPQPPKHLKGPERALWYAITYEYYFDEASMALLRTACEASQRARLCRQEIDRQGVTVRDRFKQIKPNPLLAAERDANSGFLKAMKALNLSKRPRRDPEDERDELQILLEDPNRPH